ncbi:MAG TPA: hypothetical protein VNE58_00540, partial [Casimicrobiaceae bacterium]|nr:hypothetical protein [Casimicrobiaceae bacterium]
MTVLGIDPLRWEKVSALLDTLLDADNVQREAVMSRVRRDDPALAFDVEALLAREAEVETSHFLEGTAWSAEPTL